MKKYSYIFIFIMFISYLCGSEKISTGSEFWLSASDVGSLKNSMLIKGDESAALKLSNYYFFSLNDKNRGLCCLFISAKLGNAKSAEALENYYKIPPIHAVNIFNGFKNDLERLKSNKDILDEYILYCYYAFNNVKNELNPRKKNLEEKNVTKKLLEIKGI